MDGEAEGIFSCTVWSRSHVFFFQMISPPISPSEAPIAIMANKDLTGEFGQCSTLAKDLKDSPKKLQAMRNVSV